jgi:hypothetical protein
VKRAELLRRLAALERCWCGMAGSMMFMKAMIYAIEHKSLLF